LVPPFWDETTTLSGASPSTATSQRTSRLDPPAVTSVGPDHSKTFLVEVSVNRRALAKAKGPSKKNAEQKAAQKALKSLLGRRMKSLAGETFVLKK